MFTAVQKTWKREQAIMIRPTGRFANRPPAFRRHVNEVIGLASRCATIQVKSEPEFVQQPQFETNNQFSTNVLVIKIFKDYRKRLVKIGMGVTLRQQSQVRGKKLKPVCRMARHHKLAGALDQRLHLELTKMILQPCPPRNRHGVAWLQYRTVLT